MHYTNPPKMMKPVGNKRRMFDTIYNGAYTVRGGEEAGGCTLLFGVNLLCCLAETGVQAPTEGKTERVGAADGTERVQRGYREGTKRVQKRCNGIQNG